MESRHKGFDLLRKKSEPPLTKATVWAQMDVLRMASSVSFFRWLREVEERLG